MGAGWSVCGRVREQRLFLHVPEGWIFSVGGRWSYLVNVAQRAELLARIVRINRWRGVWLLLALAVFAVIVVAADRLSGPGWLGWLYLAATAAILSHLAVIVYRAAMPYIEWIMLRSILVGASPAAAPPAPAPIDFWESTLAPFRDQTRTCSTRALVFFSAIGGLTTVMFAYDALRSNGQCASVVIFGYITLEFGAGLLLRLRARRTPAA
jgi:hypothetical protein